MEFNYLAGKIAVGAAQPKDYSEWAIDMLNKGVESENIVILAGLDMDKYPDLEEIKYYFKQSIIDLELELPSEEKNLLNYATYICREIIKGEIPPRDGVTTLNGLYSISDYEPIYSIWDALSDDIWSIKERGICYFNTGLSEDNIDQYIINVASQFIKLIEVELPDDFFQLSVCQKCGNIGEHKLERIDSPWLPEKLYRLIFKKGPTHRAICSKCSEPFPLNMGDYEARKQYLSSRC